MSRAHRNVAVVAFANKLARIAWAVLRRGRTVCRPGRARGGVVIGRSDAKAPIGQRGLREGDDEMA